jgi:pimeloyl-ACP methyl ester carboxylesterase
MTTQFLENEQGTIAFDVAGNGPLLICVPGMGDLRAEYRFLAPALVAAGYTVITMDVRGHGESSTHWNDFSVAAVGSDVLALIRKLDAGPAVLIGTSMAAGAVIWAAAEAPQAVSGLVMFGPAVRGEVTGMTRILYQTLLHRPWGLALWKSYFSSLFPTRKPADFAEYIQKLEKNLKESGRVEALGHMMMASKAASESRLSQVHVPVQIFMGTLDPDFKDPQAEVDLINEKLHGESHLVAGAGHYPHVEMPEVVIPEVLPFLKEVTHGA